MTDPGSSRLISATAIMAAGTMMSRIVGFGRVLLIAAVLGNSTRQADMYSIATMIPNSIYILLAGGALNTVLVPQIVRAVNHDEDQGEAYTNRIMTAFLIILAALTAVATLLAPLIIRLYSGADWHRPELAEQYDSMITLAYLTLPQIFFFGAFFLAGQVLNARGKFGPMMWAPIANNVVSIIIFLIYLGVWSNTGDASQPFNGSQELLLGIGATAGIAVQAAILVPFLRAAGFHYRPRFDFKTASGTSSGLGHTFQLAKWTLGFVVVSQAALVVVSKLASDATATSQGAGLTTYNNAYLLWILPHSLITVSLATAMLPNASRLAAAGDLPAVGVETMRTMRLAVTALVPATVAFLCLAHPMAQLLFGNGRGAHDAQYVGWALIALAAGLVPFTLQYICLRAFYAFEDTRSTFFLQLIIAAVNVTVALITSLFVDSLFVAASLGLAYSIAYYVGLTVSYNWLKRKLPGLSIRPLLRHCVRLVVAVLPGGLAAAGIYWLMTRLWSEVLFARIVALAVAGLVAVGIFLLLARVLHIAEVNDIVRSVLRRGRSTGGVSSDSVSSERGGTSGTGNDSALNGDSAVAHSEQSPSIEPDPAGAAGASIDGGNSTQAMEDPQMIDEEAVAGPYGGAGPDEHDAASNGTAESDFPTIEHPAIPAGTVLAGRYRLEEILAETKSTITWRAFDQVLSRSVLTHVLPPGDEREPRLLAAARRASSATDSRFLRVLDAVHSDKPDHGSYIVCEYATGQSLEVILGGGPLTGLEAAWVVREVADALSGVHAEGLYHQRISPSTVVITPTGNVKIVGLLLEEAIRPDAGGTVNGADTPEARDALDLGRLLYSALVSRWPGGPAFGLADAPAEGPRWMTPRQVRAGVSPALDRVCDQILGQPPRHKEPLIGDAIGVVNALTKVLGAADAASDLERRLRQPIPTVGGTEATGQIPVLSVMDFPTEQMSAVDRPGGPVTITAPIAVAAKPAAPATVTARVPPPPISAKPATTRSISSPPTATNLARQQDRPPRRWVPMLIILLVLILIGALVTILALQGRLGNPDGGTEPSATPAPPAGTTKINIEDGQDFDPQGDPDSENPNEVPNAFDGDPETRWRTMEYWNNPELGGLKRGVGIVFDLGQATDITKLTVQLSGDGTNLDIRVPEEDPGTITEPPMKGDKAWRVVGKARGAGTTTDITLEAGVNSRFVLVYLTSLPREGSQYRGGIYEVEVFK